MEELHTANGTDQYATSTVAASTAASVDQFTPGSQSAGGNSAASSSDGPKVSKKRPASVRKKGTKIHKRVLAKQNEPVGLTFRRESENIPLVAFRHLIQKVHLAHEFEAPSFTLTNPRGVKKLVFCFVAGLTRDEFKDDSKPSSSVFDLTPEIGEKYPFISKNFAHGLGSTVPGDNRSLFPPLKTLVNIPLTKPEKRKLLEEAAARKITIHDLRLNKSQLDERAYPIHSQLGGPELPSDWVETEELGDRDSTIFAIDCEFCASDAQHVLARITIVNFGGEVVLDSLVKPEKPITDYKTKYSGITEEMLQDVEVTHADIQEKFKAIVSSKDYLLGHSLESDLNVLRIRHPNIVDTALIYDHHNGPPARPSLKWLAQKYLQSEIQKGEQAGKGHSSIEDSTACLDLVKTKIANGLLFGRNCDDLSVLEKIRLSTQASGAAPVKALVFDYQGLQSESEIQRMVVPRNDDDVIEQFSKEVDKYDIIVLSLRQLEADLGWASAVLEKTNEVADSVKLLNDRLDKVYSLLPQDSIFVVTAPIGGDNKHMRELCRVRAEFRNIERLDQDLTGLDPEQIWDFDKEAQLRQEVKRLRNSVSFVTVKPGVH